MSQLFAAILMIVGILITACGITMFRDIDRQHQQRTVSRYALASRYVGAQRSQSVNIRKTKVDRFRLPEYLAPMARISEPVGTGSALMTRKVQIIPTRVIKVDGRRRRVPVPAHRIR